MKVLRRSGKYLKTRLQIYWGIGIVCLFICALLFLTWFPQFPIYLDLGRNEFGRGTWLTLLLFWAFYSRSKYRSYKKGFEGEQNVSDYLVSKLSDDYHLINDVKRLDGKGNIDHIILAQNEIFVLETKNNSGKIFFNGDNWSHGWSPVSQVRSNAWAVYDMILSSKVLNEKPDRVQGIVVFPKAEISRTKPTENPILTLKELPSYLLNFGNNEKRYSVEEIEEIGKVILNISNQTDLTEERFTQSIVGIIKEYF